MVNRFVLNETSYHGTGAIANIAVEAKNRAFKKAFVCSDPDLIKIGVTKKVFVVFFFFFLGLRIGYRYHYLLP